MSYGGLVENSAVLEDLAQMAMRKLVRIKLDE